LKLNKRSQLLDDVVNARLCGKCKQANHV